MGEILNVVTTYGIAEEELITLNGRAGFNLTMVITNEFCLCQSSLINQEGCA